MHVKLLLALLIISIYFSFTVCFKDSRELLYRYEREIYDNKEFRELNTEVCATMEADITARMKVCRRVIKLLRNDTEVENRYRYSLYMNYKAFTDPLNPVCEEKKILLSLNTIEKHMSITCYGRPAVIAKNPVYLKEISILYGPKDSVIVLKCSGYIYCELLDWFEKNDGSSFTELPAPVESLVAKNVPETANINKLLHIFKNSKNKVYCMSSENSHFLHDMEESEFIALCHILLNSPNYKYKCRFAAAAPHKSTRFYDVTVYYPFVKPEKLLANQSIELSARIFNVKAYPCTQYVTRNRHERTFKIMAGRNETSIIIIEPSRCNGVSCLVPAEMIENLDINYIRDMETYF